MYVIAREARSGVKVSYTRACGGGVENTLSEEHSKDFHPGGTTQKILWYYPYLYGEQCSATVRTRLASSCSSRYLQ